MRKERLIVPVVVVLAVVWAVAQFLASLLFERELARALADLEARGELVVERSEVERGWLTSSGSVQVSPLLGDGWHLELTYLARHGVFSTRVEGEARPSTGPRQLRLFGDWLPSSPPRWHARYQTLGGTLEGSVQLAPFLISRGPGSSTSTAASSASAASTATGGCAPGCSPGGSPTGWPPWSPGPPPWRAATPTPAAPTTSPSTTCCASTASPGSSPASPWSPAS